MQTRKIRKSARPAKVAKVNKSERKEYWDAAIFIGVLTLLYTSICIETDMYVPALPMMVKDLATTEELIQGVIGFNFLGLCLSSLWCGPIADSFGRRKTILIGMIVFVISGIACVFSQNIDNLMLWRFLQGVGAGAPMTAGFAVLLDRFNTKVAVSLVGFMNTFITLVMAGAPILGTWITFTFHWRTNFIVIAAIGSLALISFFFFIPETLPKAQRTAFVTRKIMKDVGKTLVQPQFMAYVVILTLHFGSIMAFVASQSLIFLNYLGVPKATYGFYQATTMSAFALGSLLSGPFIRWFQVLWTKRVGVALGGIGGFCLILVSLLAPTNAILICVTISIASFGAGLSMGCIAASAMEVFPHIKATASGVMGFIRMILTSALIAVSAKFFNGTIGPVAIVVGGAQIFACVIYWLAHRARKDSSHSPVERDPLLIVH